MFKVHGAFVGAYEERRGKKERKKLKGKGVAEEKQGLARWSFNWCLHDVRICEGK